LADIELSAMDEAATASRRPLGARIAARMRSGSWLTRRRLVAYPTIFLAFYILIFVIALATASGPMRAMDPMGRPVGTDFSEVWAAGRSVLAGQPERPFSPVLHNETERALFGAKTPFYAWHYPPYFLFVAALLALLPYIPALLVWQAVTLALYVTAVRRIVPGARAVLGMLAFPAVFLNVGHGQNGFLTAALICGGILLLETRPVVSGALFALLAYKPQFGLLLPIALLAEGRWRTIASAAATFALITLATIAAFGSRTWHAFMASLEFTRTVALEQGQTGWEKIQSPFAAVRAVGLGIDGAYAVQGLVAVFLAVAVFWLWRSTADRHLKATGLIVGSLLSTPYILDYDLVVMGPALAFMVAYGLNRGFRAWGISLLAFAWVAPLPARLVGATTHVPLGLISMLALFGFVVICAVQDGRTSDGTRSLG
jgi:alpha-1,2-mannosyltransferase